MNFSFLAKPREILLYQKLQLRTPIKRSPPALGRRTDANPRETQKLPSLIILVFFPPRVRNIFVSVESSTCRSITSLSAVPGTDACVVIQTANIDIPCGSHSSQSSLKLIGSSQPKCVWLAAAICTFTLVLVLMVGSMEHEINSRDSEGCRGTAARVSLGWDGLGSLNGIFFFF